MAVSAETAKPKERRSEMSEGEKFTASDASALRVAQVSQETKVFLEFQKLRSKLMTRNANRVSPNPGIIEPPAREDSAGGALKDFHEEDDILRCFGAAVILQWDTLPSKLQKELYATVSALSDMLDIGPVVDPAHSDDSDADSKLDERTYVLGQH
jgi:hypothetical protein